jgi:hypothetical protein
MRPRDRILANLEATYREQYDRARAEEQTIRMAELDAGYQRDQLMLEILLDIRDLLMNSRVLPPASSIPGSKSDG